MPVAETSAYPTELQTRRPPLELMLGCQLAKLSGGDKWGMEEQLLFREPQYTLICLAIKKQFKIRDIETKFKMVFRSLPGPSCPLPLPRHHHHGKEAVMGE